MTKPHLPSPDLVRNVLRYEPDTGRLFWKRRDRSLFTRDREFKRWNNRFAGTEAFTHTNRLGYKFGSIFNKSLAAHRVAWVLFYGEWASGFLDHKDGNPSNNRISNLRIATSLQNCLNRRSALGSTSPYKGVSLHKATGKWVSRITIDGVNKHIGLFATQELAALAHDKAAILHHGDFARLNFPEQRADA